MLTKLGSDIFRAIVIDPTLDRLTKPDILGAPIDFPWQRDIWQDSESGLYFYNLKYSICRKFSGFHGLHDAAPVGQVILPCFDMDYGSQREDDAFFEKQFLARTEKNIKAYNERNNRLRPLLDPAQQAARATVQDYMLHCGNIVQASRCSIKNGKIDSWCVFYNQRKWHKNWYFHNSDEIRALGLWHLTPEQELALSE